MILKFIRKNKASRIAKKLLKEVKQGTLYTTICLDVYRVISVTGSKIDIVIEENIKPRNKSQYIICKNFIDDKYGIAHNWRKASLFNL